MSRAEKAQQTQEAITEASLQEFVEHGFAGARLERIAQRAGVAKGTIYLYFKDKPAIFEGLVKDLLVPLAQDIGQPTLGLPIEKLRTHWLAIARDKNDRRRQLVRLMMAEGARFPELAEIYYRHLVGPIMARFSQALTGSEHPAAQFLARFPQLIVSPMLLAITWQSLFEDIQPLDAEAMLNGCLDALSSLCNEKENPL